MSTTPSLADPDTQPTTLRDSRRLIVAVFAAFVVAYTGENVLPLLIGSLLDGLGLDEVGAGILGSLELGGLAVASLLLAPRVDRTSRRHLAVLGAIVACAGHALSALAGSFPMLVVARIVAGLGEGAVIAAANSAAASARNPDRLFAQATVLGGLVFAAALVALPYVIEPWGHSGGFNAIVVITLLCLPFLFWLPRLPEAAEELRGSPGHLSLIHI